MEKKSENVIEDKIKVIKNGKNKIVRKLFNDEKEGKKMNVNIKKVRVKV